ncbi:metallophosphoesterase [Streptomyces sp. ISL-22]|uniref:metallophosphoesterase n=1 Tax=unclassified Streptomyces TaxID=2593676 RepID=UPI001BE9DBB9|nr:MULTISPECIES: metallophosphoesterase [unclassified Streptomyces]MBT2421477.1 metallophosphoesterase [Streptomyces sp. ISL-24]MBT2435630.1 metallophosphoesterase [Streptomyces sp. ISL-22]
MVIVFALVALLVLSALVAGNWLVWRRLFRDTTRGPGFVRRAGAVVIAGGWALTVAAFVAERAGAPFPLQQVLAWPGFLWLALSIYLLLGVLAGEVVRPLLRRWVERRARAEEAVPEPELLPVGVTAATSPAAEPAAPQTAPPASGPAPAPVPVTGLDPAPTTGQGPASTTALSPSPQTGSAPSFTPDPAPAPGPAPTPTPAPDSADPSRPLATPTRRLFVSRVIAGAAAAAAVGTVGYGTYGVLRGPQVKRVTVPLAKLPRAAHGYRIAVVSDVHLGPVLGRGFAQKVVDTINGTQPDLIAVVGDLVDGSVKDLGPAAAPLAQLRARHGSFFVTGNHEYFSGAEQWVEEVRRLGLRPLENARTELPHFDLAGVNDVAGESEGQGPDFAKALGDRDRARACVLLAHQPVQIHDAVDHGVDLQLSGHTHGGQLWPGNLVAELANPTLAGLERYGDTQLYVSRGAGAWGPPTRVGAPSDITLIELASRQA